MDGDRAEKKFGRRRERRAGAIPNETRAILISSCLRGRAGVNRIVFFKNHLYKIEDIGVVGIIVGVEAQ